MIRYHDEEWGVPLHDDQKQFEFLDDGSHAVRPELEHDDTEEGKSSGNRFEGLILKK